MSKLTVDTTGQIRFIYSDDLRALLAEGTAQIARASHVEPTTDAQWAADLSPVDGPVLGPFETRQQALDAEVDYLQRHVL